MDRDEIPRTPISDQDLDKRIQKLLHLSPDEMHLSLLEAGESRGPIDLTAEQKVRWKLASAEIRKIKENYRRHVVHEFADYTRRYAQVGSIEQMAKITNQIKRLLAKSAKKT